MHRMLVDHLHAELVTRDKVHAALRDREGRVPESLSRPLSTEKRERWFATGLRARRRLERAAREPDPVEGRQ